MKTNQEFIAKAITSTQLVSEGGYLNPTRAKQFLKQVFDATVLFPKTRSFVMDGPTAEIDKILVGSRIMRQVGSENEDQSPYLKNATFGKIPLATKKYSLGWEISNDALEDNIEEQGMEQTIVEMFATQMGLDLEDLALNGAVFTPSGTTLSAGIDAVVTTIPVVSTAGYPSDSNAGYILIESELIGYGSIDATNFLNAIRGDGPTEGKTIAAAHTGTTGVAWSPHPLIGKDDGWLKISETGGGNLVNLAAVDGGDLSKTTYFTMLKAMPREHYRGAAKGKLRWIHSLHQYINWQEYLSNQTSDKGMDVLSGTEHMPIGIPVLAPGSMVDEKMMLTQPKNLIFGIQRKLKIEKATKDKASIMTDMRFFNSTIRSDQQVERTESTVFGYGLTGDAKSA